MTGTRDIETWFRGSRYEPPVERPMFCGCGAKLETADERWVEKCEACQRKPAER